MKLILVVLSLVVALSLFGCAKTAEQPEVETASIKVETAVCGSCGETITDALKSVDGVQDASVDIETKVATVKFITAKANLMKLERAIADAGYDANDTKANPEAYEQLDVCCKVGETEKKDTQ